LDEVHAALRDIADLCGHERFLCVLEPAAWGEPCSVHASDDTFIQFRGNDLRFEFDRVCDSASKLKEEMQDLACKAFDGHAATALVCGPPCARRDSCSMDILQYFFGEVIALCDERVKSSMLCQVSVSVIELDLAGQFFDLAIDTKDVANSQGDAPKSFGECQFCFRGKGEAESRLDCERSNIRRRVPLASLNLARRVVVSSAAHLSSFVALSVDSCGADSRLAVTIRIASQILKTETAATVGQFSLLHIGNIDNVHEDPLYLPQNIVMGLTSTSEDNGDGSLKLSPLAELIHSARGSPKIVGPTRTSILVNVDPSETELTKALPAAHLGVLIQEFLVKARVKSLQTSLEDLANEVHPDCR